MKIAFGWPQPKELIKNEIRTLKTVANNSALAQVQPKLVGAAHKGYLHSRDKDRFYAPFLFNSCLEFIDSPIVTTAFIDCLITANTRDHSSYDMVTYSFALCRTKKGRKNHLIKKFHIDFTDTPETSRPPLHPVFHLQSPGKLTKALTDLGFTDDHLEPRLSEPRLCCAPTTLALLIDFLLREFGGDRTSPLTKLTRHTVWRSLIRDNEELVLRPYFKSCNGFFHDRECKKDPEKHQLFSQEFAYGMV